MKRTLSILSSILVSAAACGGSSTPTPPPDGAHHHGEHRGEHQGAASGHHGKEHGEHGGRHAKMDAEIHAFHEILAPIFHMDKGKARADKSCDAVTAMKDAGAKIASSRASDDAKSKAATLSTEIDALGTACAAPDRAGVEAQLDKLHDAFHAVMEAH
jgi:hypothetical protein